MENAKPELLEKAKKAKTAEELRALAGENGVELTEEQANAYYAKLHPTSGEMADDELENVAGGGCGKKQQGLTAADCPIGSHVRIRGRAYCWDTSRGSCYLVEDGTPPGGCNSTELIVTGFNSQTEMVTMNCPKCYRKFCVPFISVEIYL